MAEQITNENGNGAAPEEEKQEDYVVLDIPRRNRFHTIRGIQFHAAPTMGTYGENVYVWLSTDENYMLLWMGGTEWILAPVLVRGNMDALAPVIRALTP